LLHASLEPDQAAPDPALDRAERRLQPTRHLLERQALVVGEEDAAARVLVELVEAALQALGIAAERGEIGRAGARVLPVLDLLFVERRLAAALSQVIELRAWRQTRTKESCTISSARSRLRRIPRARPNSCGAVMA
jgi:hypothetical protein